MPFGGPNSERVLILAPHGRDAEIASELMKEAGWATLICNDLANFCVELDNGAAFGVVVEEALATIDHTCLARADQESASLVGFSDPGSDQSRKRAWPAGNCKPFP